MKPAVIVNQAALVFYLAHNQKIRFIEMHDSTLTTEIKTVLLQ